MRPKGQVGNQLRFELGFRDLEQRELAQKAAESAGAKSLNSWIVMVITAAAHRQLATHKAVACD